MHNRTEPVRLSRGTQIVGLLGLLFAAGALAYALFVPGLDHFTVYTVGLLGLIAAALTCVVIFWVRAARDSRRQTATVPSRPALRAVGPRPPMWVVLGVRRISIENEVPPNSTATRVDGLGPDSGRFMTTPRGHWSGREEDMADIIADGRLTDEDTGFYVFKDTYGRYWLIIASDARGSLGRIGSSPIVEARVLVRSRTATPTK